MTLVRFSSIIQTASGKLGAVVFSSRKGAGTIQRAPVRSRASSPLQQDIQSALQLQKAAWRSLSYLHQLAWNNTGRNMQRTNRVGVSAPYSGYQLFLHCTLAQRAAGLTPYTTIPSNRQVLQCTPAGVAFYTDTNEYYILIYPPTDYPNGYLYVQGARAFSLAGQQIRNWHSVGTYRFTGAGAIEIYTDWDDAIGTLESAEWFGLRITWHGDNALPSSPLAFNRLASY